MRPSKDIKRVLALLVIAGCLAGAFFFLQSRQCGGGVCPVPESAAAIQKSSGPASSSEHAALPESDHSSADNSPHESVNTAAGSGAEKKPEESAVTAEASASAGESAGEASEAEVADAEAPAAHASHASQAPVENSEARQQPRTPEGASTEAPASGADKGPASSASSAPKAPASSSEQEPAPPAESPEPASVPEGPREITATISIDAYSLLDNPSKLKEAKRPFLPASGVLLGAVSMTGREGEMTAFSILEQACAAYGISMEYSSGFGTPYVEGIGQLYEKDAGSLSGWKYSVNGVVPNRGAAETVLHDGDEVRWFFVLTP